MSAAAEIPIPVDFDLESHEDETVLRVKGTSSPQSVGSALAHAVYDSRQVSLRAIGAGAVNQAVKACAIARGYVAPRGIDLHVIPGFTNVPMPDPDNPGQKKDVSAIVLSVVVAKR